MNGGPGSDTLRGGSGNDFFVISSQGDFASYYFNGGTGTDTLFLYDEATIPGGGTDLISIEVTIGT